MNSMTQRRMQHLADGPMFDAHEETRLAFAWSIIMPPQFRSWKAPISVSMSASVLRALETIGMSFDVLAEACEHYTATELRMEPGDVPGAVRLVADGYAAGPAGDH